MQLLLDIALLLLPDVCSLISYGILLSVKVNLTVSFRFSNCLRQSLLFSMRGRVCMHVLCCCVNDTLLGKQWNTLSAYDPLLMGNPDVFTTCSGLRKDIMRRLA